MQLPPELLSKLTEFSSNGFLLFISQDHGVDCYCHVDNEISKMAIQDHALKLLAAQHEIDGQLMFNSLVENMEAEMKAARPKRRKKGGDDNPPA